MSRNKSLIYLVWLLIIAQPTFIILKLFNIWNISWWIVFTPIMAFVLLVILLVTVLAYLFAKIPDEDYYEHC